MNKNVLQRVAIITLLLTPYITFAESTGFQPIVGIPGLESMTVGGYVNAFFTLVLGAAAILAVVKIMLAGFQYMFSEIVTDKEKAKKDLQGAFLGLLIVFGSVTILNEINPNLTRFTLFDDAMDAITVSCEDVGIFGSCVDATAQWDGCGTQRINEINGAFTFNNADKRCRGLGFGEAERHSSGQGGPVVRCSKPDPQKCN